MGLATDRRPDPDQLLGQLRDVEARRARGRLRVYFGASAGVGKTYAMLAAAQRERAAGRDVVVGLVETHGRRETAQLLEDLPVLPRRELAWRDRLLPEFDLDAALARRPQVLLVDELAHTNVPGSRHAKRWQDVQELLAAGIEVWSAMNVQHLESLNATVGVITGVRVHETVPDTFLDAADEVVLVDVTPDELLRRLAAGQVYLPAQAERAAQNFFRKGNLIALREIALRRMAEHVEDDVRDWRVEQSRSGGARAGGGALPAWNTAGSLLACVGPGAGAGQTVRAAARLAGQLNVRWHAAYVETSRLRRLPAADRDQVLTVLRLAEELGAATAVLTGEDVAAALAAHARQVNCAMLVVGRGARTGWTARWWTGGITRGLAAAAPGLDVVEVARADSVRRLDRLQPRPAGAAADPGWRDALPAYGWSLGSSVLVTVLATPLLGRLELTNIVMLFLLGVVGVALRFGRGPAALAATANVAAFDWFFVPPQHTFAVSDWQYLVTFGVMLGVGLLVGQLTAGLQFQAEVAASREQRSRLLFELARDLSAALLGSQVCELGEAAVRRQFGGDALVVAAGADNRLVLPPEPPEGFDAGVADWAYEREQPAGLATTTLAAQAWHYLPLRAPMRVRGVLAVRPRHPRWLEIPEHKQQLETLARQVAIALERVHYVEVAQQALVEMESERLRNGVLSALSHDVRTPLTALIGLAEQLRQAPPGLAPAQDELAAAVVEQGRELSTLVGNLLEMARLQSGTVRLRLEWQAFEEVAGSALRAARHVLPADAVQVRIEPDLPLVEFDATLVERVLVNLLENAARYGRPPVVLAARATPDALEISVRDHGPGLPAAWRGREALLFDKFTRGEAESSTPGAGLGLAICKAIVEAHHGSLQVVPVDGGAGFLVRLPRRPPPQIATP